MKEYIKREVLSKIMNDIAGDETLPYEHCGRYLLCCRLHDLRLMSSQ